MTAQIGLQIYRLNQQVILTRLEQKQMCLRYHHIKNVLGFMFADAGFDVWLGNFRGCTYGKRHQTLTPKDHEFWQFT